MDEIGVAVIGFGAMAQSLARTLGSMPRGPRIGSVLVRPGGRPALPEGLVLHRDLDALIAAAPPLVVECAGHAAVRDLVPAILSAGRDVVIASVGALSDDRTRKRLADAADRPGAGRLRIAAGAIGGLDVLRAARHAGLDEVRYTGRKPPRAWAGTPAEDLLDLEGLDAPRTFFRGMPRDAARDYPKNTNVTAAVALAGIGFDRTEVSLVADPTVTRNSHEVSARGAFGEMAITLINAPLPDNPRTSWLAALSVAEEIRRHFARSDM